MSKKFFQAALILVDIQNDFCAGGALAVKGGEEIVEVVNHLLPLFTLVVTTQDWHPSDHISFREQGGVWPPHCVQSTKGAELHPSLNQQAIDIYFHKAFAANTDSYSGFDGVDVGGHSLNETFRQKGISKLYMTGLATDYCVKFTALDALKNGYEVFLISDAIRAVNVNEGDGERALKELTDQGAKLISSEDVIKLAQTANISGD